MARFRVGDGAWNSETEVLKIDRAARRQFQLPMRGGDMIQPWYSRKVGTRPETLGKVAMTFDFAVEELPAGTVSLAMEQPDRFTVALNGHPLSTSVATDWWVDPAFRRIVLPAGALKVGANQLEVTAYFRSDVNIEALYLLGDFGVRLNGTKKSIVALPPRIAPVDAASQGLPFYSGTITYRIPVPIRAGSKERLFIETPKFEAACIKVRDGNSGARMIAWQPYKVSFTGGIVDLDVVLTRRNTFGPLHLVPKNPEYYVPVYFVTEGAQWTQDYQLYPAGLLEPPVISVEVTDGDGHS
jgi:hypothetical protein